MLLMMHTLLIFIITIYLLNDVAIIFLHFMLTGLNEFAIFSFIQAAFIKLLDVVNFALYLYINIIIFNLIVYYCI
jgi:hypothetical protein